MYVIRGVVGCLFAPMASGWVGDEEGKRAEYDAIGE